MRPMSSTIDQIMEQASRSLAEMDYLTCESHCLKALDKAHDTGDWDAYARILMPLQEARRQRRMIAADGSIRLGTADLDSPPAHWLEQVQAGCVVVTHPHTMDDARQLDHAARKHHRHIEVLFADNPPAGDTWRVRSFRGPQVEQNVTCPPQVWTNNWLAPGETPSGGHDTPTPADWFLDAAEAMGNQAVAVVDGDPAAALGSLARIDRLHEMLQVVTDHEILHQKLAEAARARQQAPV